MCCWKRVFATTSTFSWQNSISLCPASFCTPRPNLPCFMDLTFQVPMHYCSLQHHILLPSPITSTSRCCFCFGSISSFHQELFSPDPVAYWAPSNLGSSAKQTLIEFCKDNTLVIENTLFQQHKRRLYTWTSPDHQ